MAQYFSRVVGLILLMVLSACAGQGGTGSSSTTTVTIALGSTPTAVGALTQTPPNTITSFTIDVLQGGSVVRTASNLQPNSVVQMTLVNGSYTFRLIAFDAVGALYQGLATASLTGGSVPLSITLSGFVAVTADHTKVNPGDRVRFSANFMNSTPTAANPLVWSATGGTVQQDRIADPYGAFAIWTAPQQGGSFTVTAKVNTAVSVDQVANGSGDTVIVVVDVPPLVIPSSLRFAVADVLNANTISQRLNPTGWGLIQNWASGTRVVDDIDGIKTLAAATLPASFPIGDTPLGWSATDSGGNTTSVQAVLHLYTPSTTTFKVTDTIGNALANVRVGGVALSSYSAIPLLDAASNTKTDGTGQLVASLLDTSESYLISFSASDRYSDGFRATGNVVSSYQNAIALNQQANATVVVSMQGGAGRIAGQVKDANNAFIPYARVDIAPKPYSELGSHLIAVADSLGNFSANLLPGDYYVLAGGSTINPAIGIEQPLASGLVGGYFTATNAVVSPYVRAAGVVRVSAGTTQAVYMQLAAGGLMAGRVTTSTGAPVINSRVNIAPYGVVGSRIYETITDINGVYQINVPAGDYRIAATNLWFDPLTHSEKSLAGGWVGGFVQDGAGTLSLFDRYALVHPLLQGGQRVANLTLQQGGTVQGRVSVGGVQLFAKDLSTGAVQRVIADSAGNYSVNMPAGTINLVVDSYSMDPVSGQLIPLTGGITGGYVDVNGVAQSVAAGAKAITVIAGQTVTQNIQLNAGTPFDATAVVGTFIP